MKKLIALALALVMAFSLIACGKQTDNPTAQDPSKPAGERKTKDEIIFAQGSDLTTMDPNEGTQERAYSLTNHIYDPLLTFDSDMKMQPALATKWEWIDELQLEIELREGVKFHNGDSFTTKDVEFTLLKMQARGGVLVDCLDRCEIISDTKMIIHLKVPQPTFAFYLTDPAWSIVPMDYYNSDPKGFAANPVGTGPYKMKEYSSGDHYTLERFDEYWGEPAKTKQLMLKIVPESGQRTILLETGEIDVAYEIPYNDVSKIEENKKLQLLTTPSMKIVMLYLNVQSKGPASNPKIRKAIEYAMDKDALVQAVCYGNGTPTWTVVPSVVTDYIEQEGYKFNKDKAKELVKEAGYEKGCTIDIWTNANQANTELCQILQNQLSEVGITLNIIVQDDNTSDTRRKAGEDFGMTLHFFQCNIGHAEYTLYWTLRSGSGSNRSGFANDEYDKLVDKWKNTTDQAERQKMLERMYEIEQEELPEIPVYNEVKMIGASAKLEGIQLSQIGAHEFQNAVVYVD